MVNDLPPKDRDGGPLELAVDTRYLQFFAPASAGSIGHPQAIAAAAVPSA